MPRRIRNKSWHTGWRAALFVFIAITASGHAVAAAFDLPQLMQLLAAAPPGEVAYTEKKFSSLLSAPVVSSGKLVYKRPDTIEKNIAAPKKENYHFVGKDLLVSRGGTERRIPLSSQPLLSAFAASLRGVLGGDLALLRNYYELTLQGDEMSWRLDMIPLDGEIGRYVSRITAAGRGGLISQIEVRESSGDYSVMKIR